MKPLQLQLPDDLRDELEACLLQQPDNPAQVVANILFRAERNAPHAAFTHDVADALNAMQTGHGWPAVQLDNLPPKQGKNFAQALISVLRGDMRQPPSEMSKIKNLANIGFHQDSPYYPKAKKKIIRCIYAQDPGAQPDPTIFLTADEVLQAMACERVGLPCDSTLQDVVGSGKSEAYETARADLIETYTNLNVFSNSFFEDENAELQPFLQRNPNSGEGAPEFFVCATRHDRRHMCTDEHAANDFYAATERLREHAKKEATASMQENSMVLWNDMAVLHDRASEVRADRLLFSSGACPRSFGERFDPAQRLAGAPICALR